MDALVSICIFMGIFAGVALVVQRLGRPPERAHLLSTRREGSVDTNRYTPPLTQPMPRTVSSPTGVQASRAPDIESVLLRFESVHEQALLMTKGLDRIGAPDAPSTPRTALTDLIHYLCCVRRLVEPFTLHIGIQLRQQPGSPSFAEPIEFPGLPGNGRADLIQEQLASSFKRHLERLGA